MTVLTSAIVKGREEAVRVGTAFGKIAERSVALM
jgi:hypothetical protein